MNPALAALTVPAPPPSRADWNDEGVQFCPGLLPGELIDAYVAEWRAIHGNSLQGWGAHVTPYLEAPALRALCCNQPLAWVLEGLGGEPAGVHLNLAGWLSSQRSWHSDQYLNPPEVGDRYAAVWMALDAIHPDSGPFQYVPGSHRWPQVEQQRLRAQLSEAERDDPMWPRHAERVVDELLEEFIAEQGVEPITFLPGRGDVLVWHPRLWHRGSVPNVAGMERRALIAHYSGIGSRSDLGTARQHSAGGWLFDLGELGGWGSVT